MSDRRSPVEGCTKVWRVTYDDQLINMFLTLDEGKAEQAAAELRDAVGPDRVRVSSSLLDDHSSWPEFVSHVRSLRPAWEAAKRPTRLLERIGGAACVLWPEANFPPPDQARDRLSEVFPHIRFKVCNAVEDVPDGEVVWVVRADPSYRFEFDKDPKRDVYLVLAWGRPRPENVLVWQHTAAGERDGWNPAVTWY